MRYLNAYYFNNEGKLCLELINDAGDIVVDTDYRILFKSTEDVVKAAMIFNIWQDHYSLHLEKHFKNR
jgi:hypothetical protein